MCIHTVEKKILRLLARRRSRCAFFFLFGVLSMALGGGAAVAAAMVPERTAAATEQCVQCHAVELDDAHRLACTSCHAGDGTASEKGAAHRALIGQPAHPENMDRFCGSCHQEVHALKGTRHYTLADEINPVRTALGASNAIALPVDIPRGAERPSLPALGDDLLRRRCLRCHLYTEGDRYSATVRGTGCAACHLVFSQGRLQSHRFVAKPRDEECLHCHYGNFVGADYYGRFEHDYNWEYRTPFQPEGFSLRPYGVEYHQLVPDIHQQAGMACIDCHSGAELMGTRSSIPGQKTTVACTDCHLSGKGSSEGVEGTRLKTRHEGRTLTAPALRHPAHRRYAAKAGCAVCHAQWSFQDDGTHLLRLDVMDYSPWGDLTVQSSYEVEQQLEEALYGGGGFDRPLMQDKIAGDNWLGLWLKGYGQRRWERNVLCPDDEGRLQVCRPLLDLYLSYLDAEEKTVFDSVPLTDESNKLKPYMPHTMGKAGVFYLRKVDGLLPGTKD